MTVYSLVWSHQSVLPLRLISFNEQLAAVFAHRICMNALLLSIVASVGPCAKQEVAPLVYGYLQSVNAALGSLLVVVHRINWSPVGPYTFISFM